MTKDFSKLDQYRSYHPKIGKSPNGCMFGYFLIPYACDTLRVLSSIFENWEHVSVSKQYDCPIWDEMNYIKDLFWDIDETVIQFHPKQEEYVNIHPYCLHLWKKVGTDYELPPKKLISGQSIEEGL